ncbi:hypothetical protein DEO72_LG1g2127 [Vigna unguiculata]|uniref:Uncharacterized protein n=1 Tax=Vigna unguiculata TaxID=3917 RepID=A0A4D6KXM0_VIGUN|nr:hypothetical protein DEO72_LG1g2127 [Vigna unguiculata]
MLRCGSGMEVLVRSAVVKNEGGMVAEHWWLARRDEGCRSVSADNGTLQICDVCSLCAREGVVLTLLFHVFRPSCNYVMMCVQVRGW